MNKADLVEAVASDIGLSKADSARALESIISSITSSLQQGEKVSLTGFGTFEVKIRKAREGRNPRTGEKISIEAKRVPAFRAGKELKAAVA